MYFRRYSLVGAIAKLQLCLQVLLVCGDAEADQERKDQHTQFIKWIASMQMDTVANIQAARSDDTAQKGCNTFLCGPQ